MWCRKLAVALVVFASVAVAGCDSFTPDGPGGHPIVGAAWPDYVCDVGTKTTARTYLDQITALAKKDHDDKVLSDADFKQINDDIAYCSDPKHVYLDKNGKPNDDEHCGHVMNALTFANKHAWIGCAKELELGHM